MLKQYLASSIGKKQVVAVSGLMLILFLIMHLAGNLLIFRGPDVFNAYSEKLHSLGPVLFVIELSLTAVFLIHICFTAMVVVENRRARAKNYAVNNNPVVKRSLPTRLMPYTGAILIVYLISHLIDFTFTEPSGAMAMVHDRFLGLYGLVFNSFLSPIRVVWYWIAMAAIGFHLAHAIQSVVQTFGFNHPRYTPVIQKISLILGIVIALAFSSIPFYVLFLASGGLN
ncbi:MAG: succinate dehydrogenase cytochrome b subunit [Candidatus Margulisiibacteriota bacterium]